MSGPVRGARRLARPLGRSARRRAQRPVLSVVIPVYGVRDYLPPLLDSVLGQDLGDLGSLEVIAVDDSSVDGSWDVLREYRKRDHRVRLLRQENSGQGVARDLGTTKARGEFLTFVDGDDVIPPGSFARMLRSLRATGSDLVIGDVRRSRHGVLTPTAWSRVVHRRDVLGTTLEEFPDALLDVLAANRMVRTAFWREHGEPFKARIPFQDHVPMLAAFVRAERFDVLHAVTYHWRDREDRSSTSQQKARLTTLRHRVDVKTDAWALLQREATTTVQDAWLGRTLEVDFPPFLPHALAGDADYRDTLQALYRTHLDRARERPVEAVLDRVSARQKVRAHLAAEGRWDDLAEVDAWFDETGVMPPAAGREGVVVAEWPSWLPAVPEDALRLSVLETQAEGGVLRVRADHERLHLTGWFVVRGLGVTGAAEPRLWLERDGARLDLEVAATDVPEANLWGRQRFADYSRGGFEASVPLHALGRAGTWALRGSTTYAGVTREGPLLHRLPRTSGARPLAVEGLTTRWDDADGFVLDVSPGSRAPAAEAGPRVTGARAAAGVLVLELSDGGTHEVLLTEDRAEPGLAVDPSFAGSLPLRLPTPTVTAVVGIVAGGRGDGGVVVDVEPPLPLSAWGVSGRQRLESGFAPDPGEGTVLLAGPDQAVLAGALEGSAGAPAWATTDLRRPVPAGASPVLVGDPAFYAALAAASLVVADEPLGPWFTREARRPRLVTTGGRYPWAAFGRARWEADGMTPARIERELARARRTHDLVVAPSDEVAGWYVANLGLDPDQVLVTGCPRTDPLVTATPPDGPVVRVLHDSRVGSAEALGRLLGPGYVVAAYSPDRPEDLLSAHVAVLGTGPLRFDWAVTGRPVVLAVADLDAELTRLAPLVPWEETAPGPVLDSLDAVAEALRDLDGLTDRYVVERAALKHRFHPLADGHAAERLLAALR